MNINMYSSVLIEHQLCFLPIDTQEEQDYIAWMNLALSFAHENREAMMYKCKEVVYSCIKWNRRVYEC